LLKGRGTKKQSEVQFRKTGKEQQGGKKKRGTSQSNQCGKRGEGRKVGVHKKGVQSQRRETSTTLNYARQAKKAPQEENNTKRPNLRFRKGDTGCQMVSTGRGTKGGTIGKKRSEREGLFGHARLQRQVHRGKF